jgi:hypothetical protein
LPPLPPPLAPPVALADPGSSFDEQAVVIVNATAPHPITFNQASRTA